MLELTGKLIKILPEMRGESARGPWVRGGFVIETESDYPRQVAFDCFGEDRVAMINNMPMGSQIMVRFNPESREFNEKWYTNLRCISVQSYMPGQMPPASAGYSWPGAPQPGMPAAGGAPAPAVAPAAASAPSTPAATPAATPFASTPSEMPNSGDDLPF